MIRSTHINTKAGNIYCISNIRIDDKCPIVFIHGLGCSSSNFEAVLSREDFKKTSFIIADLLGYGKSDKPLGFSYDLEDQADALKNVFDELKCHKVTFVAHSMGGVIAVLFSKKYPEMVNKLILAEANLTPENAVISANITNYGSEENFKEDFNNFINRFNKKNRKSALRFYNTLTQATYYSLYRSAVSLVKHTQAPYYSEFLRLDVACYFIRGEKSNHKLQDYKIQDFKTNKVALYTVPNAGHGLMGDNQEAFYSTVWEILNNK